MLTKYAKLALTPQNTHVVAPEEALSTTGASERFRKLVAQVKKVSKRSDEFTYFVCRAIHAMEAANKDATTGDFSGDGSLNDKGMWTSASGLHPYINQNGDGFPEGELLADCTDGQRAFETFIGRGLFVNHASDDVEKIRGIVLDAAWVPEEKGVDILVACDKKQYPDLARQIEAGYCNDVSMGTQVQFSICSECGNKAVTENDYCDHVRQSKGMVSASGNPIYEINHGLNFIEISVVANGADPKAKIKHVIASLNRVLAQRGAEIEECADDDTACQLRSRLENAQQELEQVAQLADNLEEGVTNPVENTAVNERQAHRKAMLAKIASTADSDLLHTIHEKLDALQGQVENIGREIRSQGILTDKGADNMGTQTQARSQKRKAYFYGGGGDNEPQQYPIDNLQYDLRENGDKHMMGQGMESGNTGMHPGYGMGPDANVKEELLRARNERKNRRHAILAKAGIEQEAYFYGGGGENDPQTYPVDELEYNLRENEDKQMVGQGMEPGNTGMHPGYSMGPDEKVKEELLRAKLRAKFIKGSNRAQSRWIVYAGNQPILETTAEQLYGDQLDQPNVDDTNQTNWEWVSSEAYGKNLLRGIQQLGFDQVKRIIAGQKPTRTKTAQEEVAEEEGVMAKDDLDLDLDLGGDTGEEGADLDLDLEEGEESEEGDPTENLNTALDQITEAVEQIRALQDIIGDDTAGLDEDLEGAGEELGGLEDELGDAGEELGGLEDELKEASKNPAHKKQLQALMRDAISDAMLIVKRARTVLANYPNPFNKKTAKANGLPKPKIKAAKSANASMDRRSQRRRKIAQDLYNVLNYDAGDEAHPNGGTDTKAGGTPIDGDGHVETQKEQQEADVAVANKDPRGELVASRKKARRDLVAQALTEEADDSASDTTAAAKCLECGGNCGVNGFCPACRKVTIESEGAEEADTKEARKRSRHQKVANLVKAHIAEAQADEGNTEVEVEVTVDEKADTTASSECSCCDDCGNCDCDGCSCGSEEDSAETIAARTKTRKKMAQQLRVEGEVDAETKSYYKELWGGADPEASQFANDLTSEFAGQKAKTSSSLGNERLKMKRAYQVVFKQIKLGQIGSSRTDLEAQVDRLMEMDDKAFSSFAEAIENSHTPKPTKQEIIDEDSVTAAGNNGMTRSAGFLPGLGREAAQESFSEELTKLNWS